MISLNHSKSRLTQKSFGRCWSVWRIRFGLTVAIARSCPQVFNLCSIQPLVKNARYFFDLGSKIAGALAV